METSEFMPSATTAVVPTYPLRQVGTCPKCGAPLRMKEGDSVVTYLCNCRFHSHPSVEPLYPTYPTYPWPPVYPTYPWHPVYLPWVSPFVCCEG